ncbi:ATP-binding cassette domain-containing protein [Corynebacterium breve]|uniref:ATP-binding cassette domain-containing protein n=1 Tax=Corynebacterium breve TaxID=3049799 RepID=A0ABY8VG07_9CORY|nr:ATP-binding cassette domain-containing protein [Corynebacterium breve]WIM68591.1 ATP-binding cassette domain-containing protein [Corynebacterium breve]
MDLELLPTTLATSHNRTVQVIADSGQGLSRLARTLHENVAGVAVVTQDPHAHISLLRETVIEEVAISLEQYGIAPEEMQRRCERILPLSGLTHLAERHPTELSGGQTRRLAIATIAILEPRVLVLDDPFAGLDPHSITRIIELFRALPSDIIVLGNRPRPELGATMLSLVDDHLIPHTPSNQKVALPERVSVAGQAPWEFQGVTARRGGRKRKWWQFHTVNAAEFVVGPLDITVYPGQVVLLQGENGSGKTTLLRAMAGLDGHAPVSDSVSLAFQHAADQVVDSTVEAFVGDRGIVDKLGFDPEQHPLDLPARDLRLAQLAAVSAQGRDIVLLDEPDVGLDTRGRTQAHELLADALRRGAGVVLTCHDESFVREVSGYAAVRGFVL